jgi:hypothetical protein
MGHLCPWHSAYPQYTEVSPKHSEYGMVAKSSEVNSVCLSCPSYIKCTHNEEVLCARICCFRNHLTDLPLGLHCKNRSQWSRGLRHEPSSPLERWGREFESYSRHGRLCALIMCLCCSVCALRRPDPSPKSPTDCETENTARVLQRAVDSMINARINYTVKVLWILDNISNTVLN